MICYVLQSGPKKSRQLAPLKSNSSLDPFEEDDSDEEKYEEKYDSDQDELWSMVRFHSDSLCLSAVRCSICCFPIQESSLFRTCTYEFMAPGPYKSMEIKVTLRDGHYLVLLNHVNDVIKGIDSFESVRHLSSLRKLVLALLGYQIKPFRMCIPAMDCCEFLKRIETLVNGWMAIYQTSALSPCPDSAKTSLKSEVVRVKWSRVDLNELTFRYTCTDGTVFDIAVHNTYCRSEEYLFHFSPSAWFLFKRFGWTG